VIVPARGGRSKGRDWRKSRKLEPHGGEQRGNLFRVDPQRTMSIVASKISITRAWLKSLVAPQRISINIALFNDSIFILRAEDRFTCNADIAFIKSNLLFNYTSNYSHIKIANSGISYLFNRSMSNETGSERILAPKL